MGHLPPLTKNPQGQSVAGPGAESAVHWMYAAAWHVCCQDLRQVHQVADSGADVILLWLQDLAATALRLCAAIVSGPWAVLVKCSADHVAAAPIAAVWTDALRAAASLAV